MTLCQENRRFIEAYMIGINHEMGRELVWREFPTDQRGTIFGYFWDPTVLEPKEKTGAEKGAEPEKPEYKPPPDVNDIHKWTKKLGQNKERWQEGNLVLVIKGDLIRRYPGTIVYAQKTTDWDENENRWKFWSEALFSVALHFQSDLDQGLLSESFRQEFQSRGISLSADAFPATLEAGKRWQITDKDQVYNIVKENDALNIYRGAKLIDPVFRAQVGRDILFVGFPFSLNNIHGDSRDGEYYFVLQENQDLPRFGLDVQSTKRRRPDESDDPQTPTNDLSWDSIAEGDMKAKYIINFANDLFGDGVAPNAASIAAKTYQQPVRVVIHSSELLKEERAS